ncbi:MAG: TonB-dependent receptor plug domain-containing protein [Bacteroidota bacterium]
MRIILAQLFLLLMPLCAFADDIEGMIVDEKQSPIAGAYIIHLQSDHHAHSNEFGSFFLKDINVGDTLQVLHLGYETAYFVVEQTSKRVVISMTESVFNLDEVVIGQNIKQVNIIASIDILTSSTKSSQEILRKVPGLIIGQHAGGGKAEQIFLRGFDIDHGTDINITVDGMPVNMVSHAHGQGYSDMHFIIPETLEEMDFGKGPYYADKGNFGTAGYVQFKTKDKLEESQIGLEFGRFNTMRAMGMLKILDTDKHNLYAAAEYVATDGPVESSQNFFRNNIMVKYSADINARNKISVLASHFTSTWDASGQIPQRAVDQGLITRFGAIDDTEGGETNRTNVMVSFDRAIDQNTFIKNRVYYNLYDFELYSNFTFFLDDPVNADQIRQKEKRQIFGIESVWNKAAYFDNTNALFQVGIGMRSDDINDNELSRSKNRRETLENIQLGQVDEQNMYAFASAEFDVGRWLFQPGVRLDYFKFNYVNDLDTLFNRQSQTKAVASPKFNIIYNMNESVQLFLKSGIGFHSNDARVVLQQTANDILPRAFGADIGTLLKPTKRLVVNAGLWYLFLEQEFVYVGDAGIVEPSGKSRRLGVDFGLRYQLNDWLFLSGDVNYAYARSVDEPEGADFIPLAPILTSTGGLFFKHKNMQANIQYRYVQDRPANEDDSITAIGYFITDVTAQYDFKQLSLGFAIENLFNSDWNETQFATESRLRNETESVEEIHFTPGIPFFIKGMVKYRF